jgi:hypothetical protein
MRFAPNALFKAGFEQSVRDFLLSLQRGLMPHDQTRVTPFARIMRVKNKKA